MALRAAPVRHLYCALVQLSIFFIGGAGCDNDRPPPPARSAAPGAAVPVAELLGIDAGDWPPSPDPPAPPGNLEADLEGFTTIDTCVEAHAHLDPLVGEALDAIGYDTFLRDACRLLDAAKTRDPKRCELIDASALRERCQATVAQVARDADACPWASPGRPQLGRDPACVAIASRDVRLCEGVSQTSARTTCEAILVRDKAQCRALPTRPDAARCARSADRWSGVVGRSLEKRTTLRTAGTLRLDGIDAGPRLDVQVDPDVRRGVVVTEDPGGDRFVVGPMSETGLDFIAPSPYVRATLALEVVVPTTAARPDGGGGARIERAELAVPGRAPLATPVARCRLRANVSHFDPTRGAPLELAVDGTLSDSAGAWDVHAELTTFVRDVVRGASAAAPLDPVDSRAPVLASPGASAREGFKALRPPDAGP